MKKVYLLVIITAMASAVSLNAQTEPQDAADTASAPKLITLEQALQIAVSENASVKVADMEIERTGYARRGTYASLFPQIDGSASYQRTIKKQVMYMDMGAGTTDDSSEESTAMGIEVGMLNTYSAGISASMPLINAQLWQSLKVSDKDVELAIEKARSSRLEMVNQVKQAFFACLLAKESFKVYKSVYENAVENLDQTQKKYNAQRASELDLTRAKTTVANAVPNVYDAESSVLLTLWQLKAVMGVSLDENIDVAGSLDEFAVTMLNEIGASDSLSLENNSSVRQLAIQAEQLAETVRMQQYANLPTLSLAFSYSMNAMENNFKFDQYKWSPYSYVGLSLQVPIFAGGQRYSATKQAKVQAAQLEVQREETERQLKISIRQYLNQMETAMKSYSSALSALESATKAYDIASRSYNVGRNTLTDLNDAQLALTQAQLSVSQSVYNFLIAKANLENSIGVDFSEEENNQYE